MPVNVHADIRRLNQDEFGRIAYSVMDHCFAVHNEMGRFFDEAIYRDAVSNRMPLTSTEVLVEVRFDDFRKDYYIDLLVDGGAVFELKAVRGLGASHRSQLLNYLLLTGLSHGKLVNFRGDLVEHEFVNTHLQLSDRTAFHVVENGWRDPGPVERPLKPWLIALLHDLGAGLDVKLYENAVAHVFGGDDAVTQETTIVAWARELGRQPVRKTAPDWAFKVTALNNAGLSPFEDHLTRFLSHTELRGLHWINVTRNCVTFSTIEKD